eukprot:g42563.t1
MHKANIPGHPIVSGNGTLCENLPDYVKSILKPTVQGTPSFCHDTTDFLQKLSTYGPVELGTFLVTMDVSAVCTSIPHDDGMVARVSVLNTNNCQFPDAILQLIRFILDNIFTFDNIKTHGTAMGIKYAPQYTNFFAAQDLQPTLYTRYINDIFIFWIHEDTDVTDTVPFVVQYFPREEKLRHVVRSFQHVIGDDEYLARATCTLLFLTIKELPNLKQATVHSKLPSLQENSDHNTTQPCHGHLCETCQTIDMDTTITHGNSTHVHEQPTMWNLIKGLTEIHMDYVYHPALMNLPGHFIK